MISNTEDIIDSRDVIARIEALQTDHGSHNAEGLCTAMTGQDHQAVTYGAPGNDPCTECDGTMRLDCPDSEEHDELTALRALAEEGEASSDWQYGEALIRDSYFEEYAQELAEDTGAIDRNASWPLNHINWSAAAEQLKMDYMEVSYDDVAYWIRA